MSTGSTGDYYIIQSQMGICHVCQERKDLRCGACFQCCHLVSGRILSGGDHLLWETYNPDNWWIVDRDTLQVKKEAKR